MLAFERKTRLYVLIHALSEKLTTSRVLTWGEHITRMDAERLLKISRDNRLVSDGRRSPGRPKKRWRDVKPS